MHKVELIWAGGEHEFALGLGELRALQTAVDSGPEAILGRIVSGDWRLDDLYHTIRLGLIGSGAMENKDAAKLVTEMMEGRGLVAFKLPAQAILIAALVGPEDDATGEQEGAAESPENGNSPNSTVSAL